MTTTNVLFMMSHEFKWDFEIIALLFYVAPIDVHEIGQQGYDTEISLDLYHSLLDGF